MGSTVGTPLTPEITVATSEGDSPTGVASDAAGNFVVAWLDHFRRFAADGTALGPITDLPIQSDFDFTTFGDDTVAMDAAGDFVIGWVCENASRVEQVCVQLYKPDGTPATSTPIVAFTGAQVGVNNVADASIGSVSVAMTQSGDFVVAWGAHAWHTYKGSYLGLYSANAVMTRRYHVDGTPIGDAQTVHTTYYAVRDIYAATVHVSMAPNGSYAITWADNNASRGRFYTAAGRAASKTVVLPTWSSTQSANMSSDAHYYFASSLAGNGDLLLAYDIVDSTGTTDTIYLRRCTSYCANQGTPVAVATRGLVGQPNSGSKIGGLSIRATASNGSIVSWDDQVAQTVSGQAFDATDQPDGDRFTIGTDTAIWQGMQLNSLSSTLNADGNLIAVWGNVKARIFQGP
jgi:hypothetical protein